MRKAFEQVNYGRGALAGIVGTIALLAVVRLVPRLRRVRPLPLPEMAGSFVAPDDPEQARTIGYAAQVANGAAFAEAYALSLMAFHRQSTAASGMLFGSALWLAGTMLMMPALLKFNPWVRSGKLQNPGLFMRRLDHGPEHAATFLLGHLAFGAALGALYKHRPAQKT